MDIREMLRRFQLGQGDRAIARDLQLSRKTVTKYRAWAEAETLLTDPLPSAGDLATRLAATGLSAPPPRTPFVAAPYEARIRQLRAQGVECRAILARLREEVGFAGSYSALWRFVHALEPSTPTAVVRIETPPGQEAQVDFGAAGRLRDPVDGAMKKAWLFEAACARALAYDEVRYHALKRILAEGLDRVPLPAWAGPPEPATQFVRPWTDFFRQEA